MVIRVICVAAVMILAATSCSDKNKPPQPPKTFFKLQRVLAGRNLTVHVKPTNAGVECGMTERELAGAERDALAKLMGDNLQKAMSSYSRLGAEELKMRDAAVGDVVIAAIRLESSAGKIEVSVFSDMAAPEGGEDTSLLRTRFDCPGLLKELGVPKRFWPPELKPASAEDQRGDLSQEKDH